MTALAGTAGAALLSEHTSAQPEQERLIEEFSGRNAGYYSGVFRRIREASGWVWTFNWAAFLFGPVWAAARGLRLLFWFGFFGEALAVTLIVVGLSGNLGADQTARAERLQTQAAARAEQAKAAEQAGTAEATGLRTSAANLEKAAAAARVRADDAQKQGRFFTLCGIAILLGVKLAGGILANPALERRFSRWRADRRLSHGLKSGSAALAGAFCVLAYGLTAFRFAAANQPAWLAAAPANRNWQTGLAGGLDAALDGLSASAGALFSAITSAINAVLDVAGLALIGSPWPVAMAVILLLAWQIAGPRVAIFTAAALAYLALLGFWERAMETVALLGTAALICLLIGIPLGIWCGRNPRLYAVIRPVLDFMQTMPAFVYLIPVIALFGIGKPPGVIATLVFGTPPVVRLTVLGLQGVPAAAREAALAYGATEWFLLTRVDLPLARPSIMAGVNQTILMCLSMVVIASLIGAKGLGEDVLNALQYAAVGQGLLAGMAILLCAIVIDRIVQGTFDRRE